MPGVRYRKLDLSVLERASFQTIEKNEKNYLKKVGYLLSIQPLFIDTKPDVKIYTEYRIHF